MQIIAYIATLYEYDSWASARIFDTMARLGPAELDATPLAGLGSLRRILVHTVSAFWIWRSRLEGSSPTTQLDPADFPTLDVIRQRCHVGLRRPALPGKPGVQDRLRNL